MRARRICQPRGGALAALVLLPIAGAAVGAGTHAQPTPSFLAESVLAVNPTAALAASPQVASDAVRLAEIIKLPEVVAGARASVGTNLSVAEITRDIQAEPDVGPDLVRVDVRSASSPGAVALAEALALQAAGFARQTILSGNSGRTVLGDFDASDDGWTRASDFSIAPLAMGPIRGPAKFGNWYLQVVCPAIASCGPTVTVDTGFLEGAAYTAEAWARATTRSRVSLVLGRSGSDLAASRVVSLSARWKPLMVTWTPRADTSTAELTLQTAVARRQIYDVDAVSVLGPEPAGLPSAGRSLPDQARAFRLTRSVKILPAREIAQTSDQWRTVAWAAIGALIGLATVLAALGVGGAARRREQAE